MDLPAIEQLHESISGLVPVIDEFTLIAGFLLLAAMLRIALVRKRQRVQRRMQAGEHLDRLRRQ